MSGINPINAALVAPAEGVRETSIAPSISGPSATSAGEGSFGDILVKAVGQVNSDNIAADNKANALASGAIDDIHGTMISMKEADIGVRLVGTVRNKILDAFQELWRTSV